MVHAYFGRVAFYQVWLHNSFAVAEGGLQQAGTLLNYSGSLFNTDVNITLNYFYCVMQLIKFTGAWKMERKIFASS